MPARAHLRSVADRRLATVARRWLPPVDDPGAALPEPERGPAPARGRLALGSWHRPALRGLALLVSASLLVAGYLAWQSRPREVVPVPAVLAAGTSVAVPAPAAPITPPAPDAVAPVLSPALPAAPTSPSPVATAPTTPSPVASVVVHVAGLVSRPGLVRLPVGSRVADAVEAAGGVTRRRAADSVNLARVLVDGEQIVVTEAPPVPGPPTVANGGAAPGAPLVVDLNTASAELLDTLPGVGPVLAARIVAWRQDHGPFRSIDELGEVAGIGESILGQVRALVRV